MRDYLKSYAIALFCRVLHFDFKIHKIGNRERWEVHTGSSFFYFQLWGSKRGQMWALLYIFVKSVLHNVECCSLHDLRPDFFSVCMLVLFFPLLFVLYLLCMFNVCYRTLVNKVSHIIPNGQRHKYRNPWTNLDKPTVSQEVAKILILHGENIKCVGKLGLLMVPIPLRPPNEILRWDMTHPVHRIYSTPMFFWSYVK